VREAEAMMQRERISSIDTTARSIEEIATTIVHQGGLKRHIF
jgi:regulator of PEP synthase PpsR (kinase-PPPase family)